MSSGDAGTPQGIPRVKGIPLLDMGRLAAYPLPCDSRSHLQTLKAPQTGRTEVPCPRNDKETTNKP